MKDLAYFKFSEFVLAILTMFWGIWLLMPWDTYSSSNVFHLMATLVSEGVAGCIMAGFGLFWLVLALSGNKLKLRKFVVLFILFLWTVIDVIFIMGGFTSTATVVNTSIVILITKTYAEILEAIDVRKYG